MILRPCQLAATLVVDLSIATLRADPPKTISMNEFEKLHGNLDASKFEHRLRSADDPTHAGPLHAIFHDVAACAFDHAAGDGIAGSQVLVVTHAMLVVAEVVADLVELVLLWLG